MKFGKIKKVFAVICAATMLMSATLMVGAEEVKTVAEDEGEDGDDKEDEDKDETEDESKGDAVTGTSGCAVTQPVIVVKEPEPTYTEKMTKTTRDSISVAGTEMRTSVSGVYAAEKVRGTVVETPAADVKAALGLTEVQKPIIYIYDVDSKKSVNAMASINAAAEALETDIVACLQVELGARDNGKWVELSDGSVALKAGLPKSADKSLTYYVICVQEGGEITVLEDLDTDPDTVTFAVNAGLGAYAIVAK